MAIVSQRYQGDALSVKGADRTRFFRKCVHDHQLLRVEYEVLRGQINAKLARFRERQLTATDLQAHITEAILLTDWFEDIYKQYIPATQDLKRMVEERDILVQVNKKLAGESEEVSLLSPPAAWGIRDWTVSLNWVRLFTMRSKRLAHTLIALPQKPPFIEPLNQLMPTVTPILNHINWIFFAPRLFDNLYEVKQAIFVDNDSGEDAIGWYPRFKAQMDLRGFELGNDFLWLLAGLVNCYVLAGKHSVMSIYLGVAMQAYDFFLAAMRYVVEIGRLETLKQEYILRKEQASEAHGAEIDEYLEHYELRLNYERYRLGIFVVNTGVLFLAMCTALPLFSTHPILQMVSAAVSVSITLVCYGAVQWLEHSAYKPKESMSEMLNYLKEPAPTFS